MSTKDQIFAQGASGVRQSRISPAYGVCCQDLHPASRMRALASSRVNPVVVPDASLLAKTRSRPSPWRTLRRPCVVVGQDGVAGVFFV